MDETSDFGPMTSSDDIKGLAARVEQLERREQELNKIIEENETNFGKKRARFMEIFKQKEAELKASSDKCSQLEDDLTETKSELDNIRTAVAVSEANKEEEIAKIRHQCDQEIDTMQALLREAAEEASSSTAAQYESERVKLQQLNENYEEEIQNIRSRLSQERQLDKGKGFLSSVADIVSKGTASLGTGSKDNESLEESMRRAQQDAEILKSVVMPLEKEIDTLKGQLKTQEQHIRHLERQKLQLQTQIEGVGGVSDSLPSSPVKTTSLPSLDEITDPEEKIEKLIKYLKAEKASRTDLEMFVAVINTQKAAMQDENDKIRAELNEVCTILDEEKKCHGQLKETWQMANDQFLESQRLMMMDMRRMEALLSAEQQRLLAEQQKKDSEREAQERKVKELEDLRQKQERTQELQKSIDAVRKVEEATKKLKKKEIKQLEHVKDDISASNTSVNSIASADSLTFDDSVTDTSLKKSQSNLDLNSISEQEFLDSGEHETRSLSEVDNLTIRISPEKVINLPSLTEAQKRAIMDPTPENEARKTLLASAKSRAEGVSLEGKRLVSDKEWSLVQEELRSAREKLGRPCDMCNNYEAQLQGVQDELKTEQAKVRSLDRESKAEKQTIDSQKNYIGELEETLRKAASDATEELGQLSSKVMECERYMSELRQEHTSAQLELQDSLQQMTKQREEIQKELASLQDENDSLQGKHSKHAEQLQNEDINLPNNLDDMQLLLLKYREEIISAKVAKEHTEETLRSELMFVKDRVVSEQQEKATMEETLTQEINSLQERLAIHDSIKSELERESSVRSEAEARCREMEQSLKSQQAKSKQLIGALQKQIEEHSNARTQLENDVHSLRCKIQSLQGDLDNSEAVQRDFVKLSQSLQIQLEQIRQAENEVRWQNEEDIEDCSSCRQPFSVTKRKSDSHTKSSSKKNLAQKHHCRHCGRIFCSECITKTVPSGPNMRPAKVCDVCHTILVKDATPYFSTDLPATPD